MLFGSSHGLTTDGVLFYLLSNTTFGQSPAMTDYFGSSFSTFDFDGDGRPDLAIGVEGAASVAPVKRARWWCSTTSVDVSRTAGSRSTATPPG